MQTVAKERMWLNANKDKLYVDGHPKAATLYAASGDIIPDSAKEKLNITDDGLVKGSDAEKQRKQNEDKSRRGGEDKSGRGDEADKGGGNGATDHAFTKIKGIGKKTAEALVAAEIDTVEKLSKIDLENPPNVEGVPVNADWASWSSQAAEMLKPGS